MEQTTQTVSQLQSQLSTLQGQVSTLTAAQDVQALTKMVAAYKGGVDELYTAVTSVELVSSFSGSDAQSSQLGGYTNISLKHGTVGEDSKFGDNEDAYGQTSTPVIAYVKGTDIKNRKYIVVRVNPVNADLTKGTTIKLINSKGESLEDVVEIGAPERYTGLITRASSNTGLWKLPVSVKNGVSEEQFNKAVTDPENEDNTILYAVAVKNTTDTTSTDERYVVSSYDVSTSYKKYVPATDLYFTVNKKSVNEIHNRLDWIGTSTGRTYLTYSEDGSSYRNLNGAKDPLEYKWTSETSEDFVVPATAFNRDEDIKSKKAVFDQDDARAGYSPLQVSVNKPFSVKGVRSSANDKEIDYYYVTLDLGGAIESYPSERNAWMRYNIQGLNKTVPADSTLNISINDELADGDIIGFRLYAVNCDGTLADPDGKAFYVAVGDVEKQEIKGNILADKQQAESEFIPIQFNTNYSYDLNSNWSWSSTESGTSKNVWRLANYNDNDVFPSNNVRFKATYYDADSTEVNFADAYNPTSDELAEVKFVRFTINNVAEMVDGSTAELELQAFKYTNNSWRTIPSASITAHITKTLPTGFPATISFRPKQEVNKDDIFKSNDGSGYFVLYMNPENGYDVSTLSDNGYSYLSNIFYGLENTSDKVSFSFDKAKKNADNEDVENEVAKGTLGTNDACFRIDEAVSYIDAKTWHDVVATYNYGPYGLKKGRSGNYEVYDIKRNYGKDLHAMFACWESANRYSSTAPTLRWNAIAGRGDGSANFSSITVGNRYDNDHFGGKLRDLLLGTKANYTGIKFLKVITTAEAVGADEQYKPVLLYRDQVNPYYRVTIKDPAAGGNSIEFTQISIQSDNAPRDNHQEDLVFYLRDSFTGHISKVTVKVNVNKPSTAAKKH